MKIPTWILSVLFGAALAGQGWIINELIGLKGQVSGLSVKIELLTGSKTIANK
jgi:hypothetical protein